MTAPTLPQAGVDLASSAEEFLWAAANPPPDVVERLRSWEEGFLQRFSLAHTRDNEITHVQFPPVDGGFVSIDTLRQQASRLIRPDSQWQRRIQRTPRVSNPTRQPFSRHQQAALIEAIRESRLPRDEMLVLAKVVARAIARSTHGFVGRRFDEFVNRVML